MSSTVPSTSSSSPSKRLKEESTLNGNTNNNTTNNNNNIPRGVTPLDESTSDSRVVAMRGLYPPGCVRYDLPLTREVAVRVTNWRAQVENIIKGVDDRVLAIVGPCSIHDTAAGLEYAKKLKPLANKLVNDVMVVMRVYFEKPRTTVGWKGLINDPDLDGSYNINKGLKLAREFLLHVNELGLPVGTEFLDTISPQYTSDLVSWGAIGARTTESQVHRELASGLSCPVGFKNGTAGSVQVAVDAVQAAQGSHSFLGVNEWGNASIIVTKGNDACHVILRGGSDGPNFSAEHVNKCSALLKKAGVKNQAVMIDCSHGNSQKLHKNQPIVNHDISEQLANGSRAIMGIMVESNLVEGNQKCDPGITDVKKLIYGQSITDACIDFPTTETLLEELASGVRARRSKVASL
jgi:3-deoxy-7-phosphoheptulonate synthase